MSITLTSGPDDRNNIQVSQLADLRTMQSTAPTLLRLADSVIPGLTKGVEDFPGASSPVKLSYQSGNNSWTLGDYCFGLSGGVDSEVAVIAPGQKLFDSYIKTFPTTVGTGLDSV